MDGDFNVVGIGFYSSMDSSMERYWTQNFGGSQKRDYTGAKGP